MFEFILTAVIVVLIIRVVLMVLGVAGSIFTGKG